MAGYSGAPLAKKLGIKPNTSVLAINAPKEYNSWVGNPFNQFVIARFMRATQFPLPEKWVTQTALSARPGDDTG